MLRKIKQHKLGFSNAGMEQNSRQFKYIDTANQYWVGWVPTRTGFSIQTGAGLQVEDSPLEKEQQSFHSGGAWVGKLERTEENCALFLLLQLWFLRQSFFTEPRLASSSQFSCLHFWNGKITVRHHHIQLELSLGGCGGFLYLMGRRQIPKDREGCLLSKGIQATIWTSGLYISAGYQTHSCPFREV